MALLICGSSSCAPRRETTASATPVPVVQPTPAQQEVGGIITIKFPGPPATQYAAGEEDGANSELARAIHERFPEVAVSPCLERAADAFAGVTIELERLPLAFVESALHWAGCFDASASLSMILTDANGYQPVFDGIQENLALTGFTHLGVVKTPAAAPYRWRWVMLQATRAVSMQPVPTTGQPGSTVPLMLKIDKRYRAAKLVVTSPRGGVEELKVGLSSGWAVVGIPLANDIGRQWVELMAEKGSGPEVLALFPIEIGRESSHLWVGTARLDESWIETSQQAEQLALKLLHRDRDRFGLPRLELDPRLSEIARKHSADMARGNYFAHVSPTTGSILDRLIAADYPVRFAAENLARSSFLEDAQEGLMRSPGHRAALLNRDTTRCGVGVVISDDESLGRQFYLTQIFVVP